MSTAAATIDSRTRGLQAEAASARLLMCAPDFYGVEYEINPWMHRAEQPDPQMAQSQWRKLHRVLTQEMGACIELVAQDPACPDMVFTANAALVVDNIALISRFRYPQRQMEEPSFDRWFVENGYRVVMPPDNLKFEGEGDALTASKLRGVIGGIGRGNGHRAGGEPSDGGERGWAEAAGCASRQARTGEAYGRREAVD